MPMYASPEQYMRDRSDYARKGIARGRSVVVTIFSGGVLFVAESPSATLHKVSEIYDRIGFAATGRYNEFENLRTAGIRLADVRGYSYDRKDVNARWLANAYAQTLGSIFSEHSKPLEVELCVAEVGRPGDPADGSADQLYRITYDGSIFDEPKFAVMGGVTEPVATSLTASWTQGWDLTTALRACVAALGSAADGSSREIPAELLEVAVLDRRLSGRTFRRVHGAALDALLADPQHSDTADAAVADTAVIEQPVDPGAPVLDNAPDPAPDLTVEHTQDEAPQEGETPPAGTT
ncbi:MAG: proteasome subunit alpha [Nakamurella sp.]